MIAANRRALALGALLGSSLLAAPLCAQERGHVRLQGELHGGMVDNARDLLAAPLPSGPAFQATPRALNAYAPEQHVRLKQMNFTGAQ